MTLLGLDFDNTLVRYDTLFYQLALEKKLIDSTVPVDKIAIRDYLRRKGLDEQFTSLQGEVYGLRILEASPAKGMIETLQKFHHLGIPMVIVSHKTRTPYIGPSYDLHEAALSWLAQNKFFSSECLGWSREQVFFEETKEEKIERIKTIGCTHYIDDLPEILEMLEDSIRKIYYNPSTLPVRNNSFVSCRSWSQICNLFCDAD